MPGIRLKENEPFEVAIRRFKRAIEKTGLLTELRSREFYEKPTSERKRKLSAAVKRHHKRLRSQTLPPKMYKSHWRHPGIPGCARRAGSSEIPGMPPWRAGVILF